MSIRRRNLMLGAAGATLAASAGRRAGAQESGPIRIGLAIPLSGPMQIFGKDIRIGAELAAELVNKSGGVMGRSIEPVFGDSKALANDVVTAAREMISSGIRHLCGGTQTGEALALRPVVEAAGAMLFTTGANGAPVTHENFSRRIFRATNNDVESVTAQARLAVEKGGDIAEWASIQYDSASMVAALW